MTYIQDMNSLNSIDMETGKTTPLYKKEYCVYILIFPNKKLYIGITNNTYARWKNGKGYENQVVGRAILKYGWDNIYHIVIYNELSIKTACQLEKDYIKYYDTINPLNGYNCSIGGESGSKGYRWNHIQLLKLKGKNHHNYGKHLSKETKLRISESSKGKTFSEQSKEKNRQSHIGKSIYDNKTDDEIIKINKKKTLNMCGKDNPKSKSVICINTGEIFDTVKKAQDKYGVSDGNICACCKGKRKSAGKIKDNIKLLWKYLN